jgi:hypothetical protein
MFRSTQDYSLAKSDTADQGKEWRVTTIPTSELVWTISRNGLWTRMEKHERG